MKAWLDERWQEHKYGEERKHDGGSDQRQRRKRRQQKGQQQGRHQAKSHPVLQDLNRLCLKFVRWLSATRRTRQPVSDEET